MRKLITLIPIAYSICLLSSLNAQEPKGSDAQASELPKIYTEKDFHTELSKELEIRLKRLKRNEIVGYSKELLKKEYELKVREKEVFNRELQLKQDTILVETKLNEFSEQQNRFLACLDKSEKEEEKRVKHMVDALSGMKPDAAAQVLSVQEASIAIKMLALLDSTKVSKIFNKMDKEVSARLQKQFLTMQK